MKRMLLGLFAAIALTVGVATAQSQPPSPPLPVSTSGTIATTGGTVSVSGLQGQNACTVDVGSTAWTGTLLVQGGTNWDTIPLSSYGSTSTANSITANGLYLVTTTALSQIRVSGPTSTGTATVYMFCTQVGQQANVTANVTAQTSPVPLPVSTPAAGVPLAVSIAQPIAVSTPALGVPLTVTTPAPAPTNLAGQVVTAVASAIPLTVNTPAPAPTVSPGLETGVTEVCPSSSPLVNGAYVASCDSSGNRNVRIGALASPIPMVAASSVPVTTAVIPTIASQSNLAAASNIKTTAGTLYTVSCFNTQASTVAFIQIFNALAVNVTLGTTTPILQQMLTASDTRPIYLPPTTGAAFSTAISIASTTTASGATPSANGVYCYETFL